MARTIYQRAKTLDRITARIAAAPAWDNHACNGGIAPLKLTPAEARAIIAHQADEFGTRPVIRYPAWAALAPLMVSGDDAAVHAEATDARCEIRALGAGQWCLFITRGNLTVEMALDRRFL